MKIYKAVILLNLLLLVAGFRVNQLQPNTNNYQSYYKHHTSLELRP
jgi:hypothetical protein